MKLQEIVNYDRLASQKVVLILLKSVTPWVANSLQPEANISGTFVFLKEVSAFTHAGMSLIPLSYLSEESIHIRII